MFKKATKYIQISLLCMYLDFIIFTIISFYNFLVLCLPVLIQN